MADVRKDTNKILGILGLESTATDGQKTEIDNIFKKLYNQSSSSSSSGGSTSSGSGVSGAIRGVSEYIKGLDKSSYATASWSDNILDLTSNVVALAESIKDGPSAIFKSISNLVSPFISLDQALRDNINKNLALTGNLARDIRTTIIETTEETLKYGINVGDVSDTYVGFVSTLGRAVPLNKELLRDMAMFAKTSGMSMQEAGQFLGKLENYGLSLTQGPKILEEMQQTARSMGLNTNEFIGYATENLKLINTLGFEKGVKGFTEIAAKASAIGYNISTAAATAEKLFDIDSAVEMAAQLNVLGGDFGRLGNAIDLMFSPTNDMEQFTEDLMNASKQFVTFNESKNTFDVSPLDLRRAREFAKATNQSLEEVIETGKRASKMEIIKDRISFMPNLSEEERTLIGSLGQISENGEVTIKGKTITEMSSNELSSALRGLKQENENSKKSQKEILNEQLNMFSKMNFYLKGIALQMGALGENGGMFTLLGDNLNDFVYDVIGNNDSNMVNTLQDALLGISGANVGTEGFSDAFAGFEAKMNASQMSQWNAIKQQFDEYKNAAVGVKNNQRQGFSALSQSNGLTNVTNTNNITVSIDGMARAFQTVLNDPRTIKELKEKMMGIDFTVTNSGEVGPQPQ